MGRTNFTGFVQRRHKSCEVGASQKRIDSVGVNLNKRAQNQVARQGESDKPTEKLRSFTHSSNIAADHDAMIINKLRDNPVFLDCFLNIRHRKLAKVRHLNEEIQENEPSRTTKSEMKRHQE